MKNFKYLLVAMFAAGALTACGSKEETPIVEPETPVVDETNNLESTEEIVEDEVMEDAAAVEVTGQLAEAYDAVREAYGETYLPNAAIPADFLQEIYGINPDDVVQIVAEQPMIGFHPDLFIGIEAKDGSADAVEAALTAYQEQLLADTMQYPMNLAKISACKVLRYDNYVFFVLLGAVNEDMEASEEDAAVFAETEVQKAVDALDSVFAK